jgi:hypothetical protein
MPKDRTSMAARADLTVEVLEPIPPEQYPGAEALLEAVHGRIAGRLAAGPSR